MRVQSNVNRSNNTMRTLLALLCISCVMFEVHSHLPGVPWWVKKEVCGENEDYLECITECRGETCSFKPRLCPYVCEYGCSCRAGYVRRSSSNRTCVLRSKCFKW